MLPTNQWGEIIKQSAEQAGVRVDRIPLVEGEVGVFFVLPAQKTVQFQRRHSAFALQEPGLFDWPTIFDGIGWLHATGITPAISPGARAMWGGALDAATSMGLPISFDLNHRPQLGPLDELWGWVRPYVSSFRMIILSVGQIEGLAELEEYPGTLPEALNANDDTPWRDVMRFFHQKWAGPAVACCFKRRSKGNVQRRWACIINDAAEVSSMGEPVWHVPKEETGGGSAWASGFIHGLLEGGAVGYADPRTAVMRHPLRSADVLSALCQESVGDHSTVRLPEFETKMGESVGEVFVGGLTPSDIPAELRGPAAKL